MSTDLAAYFGLFSAAFLAATILPAQSEAVLAMMILADRYPLAALIGIASFGNVLGSVVNWMLGRGIEHYRDRWFPVAQAWQQPQLGSLYTIMLSLAGTATRVTCLVSARLS